MFCFAFPFVQVLARSLDYSAIAYLSNPTLVPPANSIVQLTLIAHRQINSLPSYYEAWQLARLGQSLIILLRVSAKPSGSRPSRRSSSVDVTAHSPFFTASNVVAHCFGTSPGPCEPSML